MSRLLDLNLIKSLLKINKIDACGVKRLILCHVFLLLTFFNFFLFSIFSGFVIFWPSLSFCQGDEWLLYVGVCCLLKCYIYLIVV